MKKRIISFLLCVAMVTSLIPETAFGAEEKGELICGLEEHTHGEACYAPAEEPQCGLEEDADHTHEETCHPLVLTCSLEEHQHTDACYEQKIAEDVTDTPVLADDFLTEIPACDCPVDSARLEEHADSCARKAYCRTLGETKTAQELSELWNTLPEDVQTFVQTYLSWIDQAKLEELQALLNGSLPGDTTVTTPDGVTVTVSGGGLPEGASLQVEEESKETAPEKAAVVDEINADLLKEVELFSAMELAMYRTYHVSVNHNGTEWQPEDGTDVTVTMSGFANDLSGNDIVVTHILDTKEAVERALADGTAIAYRANGLEAVYPEEVQAAAAAGGEAGTIYYTQLTNESGAVVLNEDNTITFALDSFSSLNISASGLHNKPYIPNIESENPKDNLILNKTVSADDEGNLSLYLESYATGTFKPKPTEVVLVVDQSGSMYAAVDSDATWGYREFLEKADKDRGTYLGYYVAMAPNKNWDKEDEESQYAVALVRFNKTKGHWERTQQITTSKSLYDSRSGGFIFHENHLDWCDLENNQGSNEGGFWSDEAVYFKSIAGATQDALSAFLDQIKELKECKVALAGFASPKEEINKYKEKNGWYNTVTNEEDPKYNKSWRHYGGTGVFVNGNLKLQTDCTLADYKNAFMSVSSDYKLIEDSIKKIDTNYWNTTTDAGFEMANAIFKNNPLKDGEEVNRIVVLFTDGVPDSSDGVYSGYNVGTQNKAIEDAYVTKNTYGAKVYAFGPQAGSAPLEFLQCMSSFYPRAQALDIDKRGEVGDKDACGIAGDAEDLVGFFTLLGQMIYNNSIGLNSQAILKDIISSSFTLSTEVTEKVEAWSVPCEEAEEDGKKVPVFNHEKADPIDSENIKVDGKTIEVTGFDYAENIITKEPIGGAKLVVRVPIVLENSYSGDGKDIQTNDKESGVYDKDGNLVNTFQPPRVDHPGTTVTVTKTVVGNNTSEKFAFSGKYDIVTDYEEEKTEEKTDEGAAEGSENNSQGGNHLIAVTKEEKIDELLGNGEEIILEKVPVGMPLTITEKPDDLYTTTVKVNGEDYPVNKDGTITIKEVTPNMTIEYINTYKRADLTIKKQGTDEELDENQTFIFHVVGKSGTVTEGIDMRVAVVGNRSVTISDLPVGDYTITEESGWGWRYTVSTVKDKANKVIDEKDGSYPVKLPVENQTVTFENTRDEKLWLDGSSWCRNIFDGKGTSSKAPDSGKKD